MSASLEDQLGDGVQQTPYPIPTKQAAGLVRGTHTDVSSIYFSDKIMITISQGGRLSQWVRQPVFLPNLQYNLSYIALQVQVPLSTASPTIFETSLPPSGDDMLPLGHLTPKTLIGGGGEQRETLGHLYASQIASIIATRNPEETRTVVVGLGLLKVDMEREAFFDMLELLQKVI